MLKSPDFIMYMDQVKMLMKIWKCNRYMASKNYKRWTTSYSWRREQKRDFVHVLIVDGLIKIAFSNLHHDDAWELGTGINYSINTLFNYFNQRFDTESKNIPDQPGNYRITLRENDDTLKLLNWTPKDRLKGSY